jgi:predicted transcriptional regulator
MDRIFSARIDDRIAKQIKNLALKMRIPKKSVLEKAVELLGRQVDADQKTDVFDQTNGVWKRTETVDQTVSRIRTTFRKSMERHAR